MPTAWYFPSHSTPSAVHAITACNEHVELERLLDLLNEHIRPEDEIMLQLDSTTTDEVKQVAFKYNINTEYDYHRVWYGLNNDFAFPYSGGAQNYATQQTGGGQSHDHTLSANFSGSANSVLQPGLVLNYIIKT